MGLRGLPNDLRGTRGADRYPPPIHGEITTGAITTGDNHDREISAVRRSRL